MKQEKNNEKTDLNPKTIGQSSNNDKRFKIVFISHDSIDHIFCMADFAYSY